MANLTIEISQGIDKPTRVAVVPFKSKIDVKQLQKVIASDLQLSGRFELIPEQDMLSTPTVGEKIHFADWRFSKVEFILIGAVKQVEGVLEVSYELYDVVNNLKLLSKSARGINMRDIAHQISNDSYYKITGIEGIFDSKIVYVTEDKKASGKKLYQLKMSDQDGARDIVLTQSDEPLLSPTFSPDASKIAYVSFESGRSAIYQQDIYTGERIIISQFEGINSAPSWSPDGSKMAVVLSKDGNPEIYIKNLAKNKYTRFTNHYSIDTEPNWMPDGKSIVFTSDRTGSPQIYSKNIRTQILKRLTREGNYNARPRISQDGKFLVLINGNKNIFKVSVLNLETNEMLNVSKTKNDESPSISPNGAMIIYSSRTNNRYGLDVVSLDAGIKYRLPSDKPVREPAWSPIIRR